jgi:predicted ester cyclase
MSAAANEQLMRRWFEEVWNQKRTAAIDELMAVDVLVHGHQPEVRGREGFKQLHAAFCGAIPDIHITSEIVFGSGDLVVAHNRVEGTQKGELFGIAPSGRPIRFWGTSIARVKDGVFVEAWDQYNFLELYGQLDALDHISALRKSASQKS